MSDKQTEKSIQLDTPIIAVKQKLPKLCCVNRSLVRCGHTPAGHYGYGCERDDDRDPRISSPALTAQEIAEMDPADLLPCRLRLSLFC